MRATRGSVFFAAIVAFFCDACQPTVSPPPPTDLLPPPGVSLPPADAGVPFVLDPTDGLSLEKPALPPTLPGPCADPWQEVPEEDRPRWPTFSIDLDGDGVNDLAISTRSRCIRGPSGRDCFSGARCCTFRFWVMRGPCGHFVGQATGAPKVLRSWSHGLHDLRAVNDSPGSEQVGFLYQYDGQSYSIAARTECRSGLAFYSMTQCRPWKFYGRAGGWRAP